MVAKRQRALLMASLVALLVLAVAFLPRVECRLRFNNDVEEQYTAEERTRKADVSKGDKRNGKAEYDGGDGKESAAVATEEEEEEEKKKKQGAEESSGGGGAFEVERMNHEYLHRSGAVIELDAATFEKTVSKGIWLVEVYAKWCGHCQQLEPTWRELAKRLKKTEIYVGKLDIGKARSVTSRLGIKGIPTILLFRDGRTRIFNSGDRSLESFAEFADRGWKDAAPLPLYKDPLTIAGKVYGFVHRYVHSSQSIPSLSSLSCSLPRNEHTSSTLT